MALDAALDSAAYSGSDLRSRRKERVSRSLEAEEAAGRLLAIKGRTAAMIVIGLLLTLLVPFPEVVFYELLIALFIVAGFGRWGVEQLGLFRWWQPFVQTAFDFALLTFTLVVPNPWGTMDPPPQLDIRSGNFAYFYIMLAGLAFGYQPRQVLWGGIVGAIAWAVAVGWVAAMPDTVLDLPAEHTLEMMLDTMMQPTFVDLNVPIRDIVVFLTVSALLAFVVKRSRELVERQAALERERGNLARYFPPATVDRLARQDRALASIREGDAAVLFFDLVGFTHWAERHSPAEVIRMLRDVHARVENAVFKHDGTLDKFIGDGAMATFGAIDPGPREATNALACAVELVDEFTVWNAERVRSGRAPIRMAVGVHYGPVVVGNIGTDRRLELAALGDTVNVASRLEALTRDLDCSAVISTVLADAAREETGAEAAALLSRFREGGTWELRGRAKTVDVLAYG
ncbi:MAG: adenylate/guanylate cyclase domain-containing protein [Propylenella sp.]